MHSDNAESERTAEIKIKINELIHQQIIIYHQQKAHTHSCTHRDSIFIPKLLWNSAHSLCDCRLLWPNYCPIFCVCMAHMHIDRGVRVRLHIQFVRLRLVNSRVCMWVSCECWEYTHFPCGVRQCIDFLEFRLRQNVYKSHHRRHYFSLLPNGATPPQARIPAFCKL